MNDATKLSALERVVGNDNTFAQKADRNPDIRMRSADARDRSFQSALFQLELVMSHGRITDPRVILQAMNLYMVSNQQACGIAHDRFLGSLPCPQ